VGVVLGDRGQVRRLGPAGRTGGVPEVQHDDVSAPVCEVNLLLLVGAAGELDRVTAVRLGPGLDAAVAGDVPSAGVLYLVLRVGVGAPGRQGESGSSGERGGRAHR